MIQGLTFVIDVLWNEFLWIQQQNQKNRDWRKLLDLCRDMGWTDTDYYGLLSIIPDEARNPEEEDPSFAIDAHEMGIRTVKNFATSRRKYIITRIKKLRFETLLSYHEGQSLAEAQSTIFSGGSADALNFNFSLFYRAKNNRVFMLQRGDQSFLLEIAHQVPEKI